MLADIIWKENKVFNLIGYKDYNTFWDEAIEDSLYTADIIRDFYPEPETILDVGSGAGIPGMILAIAFPRSRVTLVESMKKRARFLIWVSNILNLSNVEIINDRIENFRGVSVYTVGVCKAVARLSVSMEYVLPFLIKKGIFIAHKGKRVREELVEARNAFNILGGRLRRCIRMDDRYYLVIERVGDIPDIYPRRAGIPEKRPL